MRRMGWHFDLHSHKNIRINHDPDVGGMARTLQECGVEEIITFAKGHDGFACYPTRVGTVHPRMKGDAFGDTVAACKAEGIRVLAYISFGVDGEAGRRHADWVQMGAPGVPDFFSEDWFVNVCPFTPYLDALVLPMIAEIVDDYPVDGFFFDTMGAMRVCHCATCRAEFLDTHGLPVPDKPEDKQWGTYGQFRRLRGWKMIQGVCRFIEDRKPGLKIGFNQIGTPGFPEPAPQGLTCLTLDFTTSGPQSLQASLCAAFGSTADRPSDVMNTIFNQGWGDWSPRPHPILEQSCATIWARKSRPYIGDRTHPANRLTSISVRAMKKMARMQRDMAANYPPVESALAPDILVLHGPATMYGADFVDFDRGAEGLKPLKGSHHLLLDAGANFSVVAEAYLERHLSSVTVVIIPEMQTISAETNRSLMEFVDNGGTLLVVGDLPACDGAPMNWTGVSHHGKPWQDHIYLPALDDSMGNDPILVRGDFHRLNLDEANSFLPSIAPYDCEHGVRFGQGIGPPSDAPSEWPALTRLPRGAGAVWYLGAKIFSDYEAHGNWTQIAWLRDLLALILPEPVARVTCDSGGIEIVAHENAESTWVFLIHHGGEQLIGERRWARTFEPMPARAVQVAIRDRQGDLPDTVTMRGEAIPWGEKDGAVMIPMVLDRVWSVLRVDWTREPG